MKIELISETLKIQAELIIAIAGIFIFSVLINSDKNFLSKLLNFGRGTSN